MDSMEPISIIAPSLLSQFLGTKAQEARLQTPMNLIITFEVLYAEFAIIQALAYVLSLLVSLSTSDYH